jgi:hypothetical protein
MSNQGSGKPPGPGQTTLPGGRAGAPQQPQQPYQYPPPPDYPPPPPPQAQPFPYPPPPPPAQLPQAYVPTPTTPDVGDGDMLKRSLGRALRLRIEPNEITPAEQRALLSSNPPITDPYMQAFLAWRRSILFLVAIVLVPLAGLRFWDAMKGDLPDQLRFIQLVPAGAEAFLCVVCWYQLKNWSHWRRQRRSLFRAWLLFMAAPFLVFLVPMDGIIEGIVRDQLGANADTVLAAADGNAIVASTVVAIKAAIAITALLTLAPKAISLLAGTVRAGIVTKMLFPGTAGPGWLVVLSAPIYTLFVFTLLIVPYQLTGSGWYVGAMIGLMTAQLALGRAGYRLARPMSHDEAVGMVAKARGAYLFAMLVFAVCLVVALGTMAKQLGVETIVTTILSFEINVLLLTLIGSDLVITNLERARGLSTNTAQHLDDSNRRLSAFVGQEE